MMLRAFICGALSACLLPFGAAQVSDPASTDPAPIDTTPFVFEQGDYRVTISPSTFRPPTPKTAKDWTSSRTASSDVQMASTRTGRVPYRLHVNQTLVTDAYDVFPPADFVSFSYEREDAGDLSERPVIFAFNGGPGSSSIWLHMSALGPKRIDMPAAPDTFREGPYELADNPAFLIDVADIVLVDPVGTGLSRAVAGGDEDEFYNIRRDARSVCLFMETWLRANDRFGAPVHIIGSSYGTIRSAAIRAHRTCRPVNGTVRSLIFVSGVLDFSVMDFYGPATMSSVGRLPTLAMTAWYHGLIDTSAWGEDISAFQADVEAFAFDDLAFAVWQGARNTDADMAHLAGEMERFTGVRRDVFKDAPVADYLAFAIRGVTAQTEKRFYRQDSRFLLDPYVRSVRTEDPAKKAASLAATEAYVAAGNPESGFVYNTENLASPEPAWQRRQEPLDIMLLEPIFKANLTEYVQRQVGLDSMDTYVGLLDNRTRMKWDWTWSRSRYNDDFVRGMAKNLLQNRIRRYSARVRGTALTAQEVTQQAVRRVERALATPRIMVASGRHDMHTPYYSVLMTLEQAGIPADLVTTHLYDGGHFFYADGEIAEKFSDDVRAFIGAR